MAFAIENHIRAPLNLIIKDRLFFHKCFFETFNTPNIRNLGEYQNMPELPEVETVRKGLQQYMEGQSIGMVEVFTSKLRWELPESFEKNLINQTITTIARRGKYLILEVSNGHCLIVHLGMTGSFAIFSTNGFPKI